MPRPFRSRDYRSSYSQFDIDRDVPNQRQALSDIRSRNALLSRAGVPAVAPAPPMAPMAPFLPQRGPEGEAGAAGADAKLLFLYSDRQIIYLDAAGAPTPTTQTTTFTVTKQNLSTGTITVSLSRTDGTNLNANTYLTGSGTVTPSGNDFTQTGTTFTLTAANFNTARSTAPGLIVTVAHVDGVTDVISVLLSQQGATGATGATGPAGVDASTTRADGASTIGLNSGGQTTIASVGKTGSAFLIAGNVTVENLDAVADSGVTVRVYRDSTVIHVLPNFDMSAYEIDGPVAFAVTDNPGSGTYTYAVKAYRTVSGASILVTTDFAIVG